MWWPTGAGCTLRDAHTALQGVQLSLVAFSSPLLPYLPCLYFFKSISKRQEYFNSFIHSSICLLNSESGTLHAVGTKITTQSFLFLLFFFLHSLCHHPHYYTYIALACYTSISPHWNADFVGADYLVIAAVFAVSRHFMIWNRCSEIFLREMHVAQDIQNFNCWKEVKESNCLIGPCYSLLPSGAASLPGGALITSSPVVQMRTPLHECANPVFFMLFLKVSVASSGT